MTRYLEVINKLARRSYTTQLHQHCTDTLLFFKIVWKYVPETDCLKWSFYCLSFVSICSGNNIYQLSALIFQYKPQPGRDPFILFTGAASLLHWLSQFPFTDFCLPACIHDVIQAKNVSGKNGFVLLFFNTIWSSKRMCKICFTTCNTYKVVYDR